MSEEKRRRSVLGSDIQSSDKAVQAYLDAKAISKNERNTWDVVSDAVSSGMDVISSSMENKRIAEENRKKEIEKYDDDFSNNMYKITENAGSLGDEYYSIATEQTKLMQQEYMIAVREGDKEAQSKLKMKLQGLSTSVGSLKENLNDAAELHNEGLLSDGRTAVEKEISAICTDPANIVYEEGEWKWKNPKFDGSEGSKEFYTMEDLNDSLGQTDEATSKAYLDWEGTMNKAGSGFVDGTSAADFNAQRIKVSIADQFITQDNIMSLMHDDFRKSGKSRTFKADLGEYLDSMGSSLYEGLQIDANGDGVFTPEDWDSDEDKKIIIDAITNKNSQIMGKDGKMKKLYNYESSKNIVADYLTMHAENKFYGEIPKPGGGYYTIKERRELRPNAAENPEDFKKRGGIMGVLSTLSMKWDEETETWTKTQGDPEDILKNYKAK